LTGTFHFHLPFCGVVAVFDNEVHWRRFAAAPRTVDAGSRKNRIHRPEPRSWIGDSPALTIIRGFIRAGATFVAPVQPLRVSLAPWSRKMHNNARPAEAGFESEEDA
jgi:hypothetical protein